MLGDEVVGKLAARILAAVTDPKAWGLIAQELTGAVGAAPPALLLRLSPHQPPSGIAPDSSPRFDHAWADQLHRFPEWRRAAWRLSPGEVVPMDSLVPRPLVEASGFYREWMHPQRLRWAVQASVAREDSQQLVLLLFRREEQKRFGDSELALLERLVPHLQQVVRVRQSLEEAELQRRAALGALDSVRSGVILLDAGARILAANRSAERLLRQEDGLAKDRHGLRAAEPEETSQLRHLIDTAARSAPGNEPPSESFLALTRPSGARPLLITVRPHPTRGLLFANGKDPIVVVLVSDPEQPSKVPLAALQLLFDFTPAEARVASLLLQGKNLNAIAETLQLSLHTVRNELKRIFAKTQTNRQAELIRLLWSGVPLGG